MFCENCGEKLNKEDIFCEKCGFEVKETKHNDEVWSKEKAKMSQTFHWAILCLTIIVLAGIFYWFGLRPTKIKKECSEKTQSVGTAKYETYDRNQKEKQNYYSNCLHEKGL